jgi:pyruvate kinase
MNVARLNFSHGDREEHRAWIRRFREVSAQMGLPLAILQDLAGPKLRIGTLVGGEALLRAGQDFYLTSIPGDGGPQGASVNYPEVISETHSGVPILLADGRIELQVVDKTPQALRCRVVAGGVLRSQAGLNFPKHSLSVPAFTAKDRDDLRFGLEQGVDFVALSYVRSPQDIQAARDFIHSQQADTPIIAKIEKHRIDQGGYCCLIECFLFSVFCFLCKNLSTDYRSLITGVPHVRTLRLLYFRAPFPFALRHRPRSRAPWHGLAQRGRGRVLYSAPPGL